MTYKHVTKWSITVVSVGVLAGILGAGCNTEESSTDTKASPSGSEVKSAPVSTSVSGDATKVMVQVGEMTLTQGELNRQLERILKARGAGRLPPAQAQKARAEFQQNLVDGFVAQAVLLDAAKQEKITVDPAEVAKVIEGIKTRAPAGVTFEQALKDFGITEATLKRDVERDLRIKQYVENYVANLPKPTKKDVEAFYKEQAASFEEPETVQARHILIGCKADASKLKRAEKKALADKCQKELKAGADFAELAKKHSDCPSKNKGGDLGTFQKGSMVPPFEKAAFSQKVKEIGPVVETSFGYHVVEVLAHNQPRKVPMAEVKEKIETRLMNQKKQEAVIEKVKALKAKAEVKYAPGMEPVVAASPAVPSK